MKILITGASGYIGRHVVSKLIEHNHDITVIDKNIGDLDCMATNMMNINIFATYENIYESVGKPDILLHLAWQDGFNHMSTSHINDLYKHFSFIQNMIKGGLKQVVCMGTMHEIGYWEGSIDENTPCNPMSYYGISKNALRQSLEVLAGKENITFQWIRAFYITGDDEKSNSIFGKILAAVKKGEAEFSLNSGKNLYDFIDIDELALQIVSVIEQTEITGIINCCSGKPISLLDKLYEFLDNNNINIKLNIGKFPDRPYDSPGVWGDNRKIKKIMEDKLGD